MAARILQSFLNGRLSAGMPVPLEEFPLARLNMRTPVQPFICSLRLVTEIIFDVLLIAYFSSLTAYRDRSQTNTAQTEKPRKSLDGGEKAIEYVNTAQQMFRDGERKRIAGHILEANADTLQALRHLTLSRYTNFVFVIDCLVTQACIPLPSTDAVLAIYRLPSLMDFWDETDVECM